MIYKVQLKPAGLHSAHAKHGFTSTPVPLPKDRILNNENSTLTVKVPRVHLTPAAREEITSRRAIWGTDVYTDDSDVVAACIHAGWIRGEWGDDVDPDLLDLRKQPTSTKSQNRAPASSTTDDQHHQEVLTAPPPTGPAHVPTGRDLHVTILILPGLEKYSGSARFGISSREWGGVYNGHRSEHDGISFMVWSIRWVDGAAPQSRLRGRARRERIHKAMGEILRSQIVNVGDKEIAMKRTKYGGDMGPDRVVEIDKENRHLADGKKRETANGSGNGNRKADEAMRKDRGGGNDARNNSSNNSSVEGSSERNPDANNTERRGESGTVHMAA